MFLLKSLLQLFCPSTKEEGEGGGWDKGKRKDKDKGLKLKLIKILFVDLHN